MRHVFDRWRSLVTEASLNHLFWSCSLGFEQPTPLLKHGAYTQDSKDYHCSLQDTNIDVLIINRSWFATNHHANHVKTCKIETIRLQSHPYACVSSSCTVEYERERQGDRPAQALKGGVIIAKVRHHCLANSAILCSFLFYYGSPHS
jgi:hypothetical protein